MTFKKFNPAAMLKFTWKFALSCIFVLFMSGIIFGMAFIVGVLIFVFSGNDFILSFMADVLNRILEVRTYFS